MERKKRQIFPEDLSVFQNAKIEPEAKAQAKVKPTKSLTNRDLEKALAVLQSFGIKAVIPTTEEDREKQESSLDKLGIKVHKPTVPNKIEKLRVKLGTQHFVGDQSYGPGEIELPLTEEALFRSLIHQDNLSKQAHFDTKEHNPYALCFVIREVVSRDGISNFKKIEVTEREFNGEAVWNIPGITPSLSDVAGYKPSSINQGNF